MIDYITRHKSWLLPVLGFLLITPFTPYLDLEISRYFYDGKFISTPWLDWIFVYGLIPGQLLGVASLAVLLGSYLFSSWRPLRRHALYFVLSLSIGAGIIVHTALKDNWGRPRPRQIIEFGGKQEFRPYYKPNFFHQPEPSKSFTCGHCSMGFYFFSLIFLGRRLHRKWMIYLGVILSLVLGLTLSHGRIAQGGHFFSDVLASALIMWLTALVLDRIIYGDERCKD